MNSLLLRPPQGIRASAWSTSARRASQGWPAGHHSSGRLHMAILTILLVTVMARPPSDTDLFLIVFVANTGGCIGAPEFSFFFFFFFKPPPKEKHAVTMLFIEMS